MADSILVTGGAGYIGSHTCVELLQAGFQVVVLDNFCNSHPDAIERVRFLAPGQLTLVRGDVRHRDTLWQLFTDHKIDAVIHFAGLKAVGESVAKPLLYYETNLVGSLLLADVMQQFGVFRLVFSSSATVYGDPEAVPVPETARLAPESPYGRSKTMVEGALRDLAISDARWRIALLRYFNPVGAHPSGEIGEDPNGLPNNLLPYVAQVAVGKLERLTIHGNDYETRDGTGERDYIHVVDLARGHLAALRHIDQLDGAVAINLGRGIGSTVLEVVHAFQAACGRVVPFHIGPRRAGDVARYFADPALSHRLLGWQAEFDIERACVDTWRWQAKYPNGFRDMDSANTSPDSATRPQTCHPDPSSG
jgi:UDP-glucose 4-epimerase